jgi:gp16 family phage-associated protein
MNNAQRSALDRFVNQLHDQDKTLIDWAREHRLNINTVYMVSNHRLAGHRGESRKIFRAMGIPLPTPKSRKATA